MRAYEYRTIGDFGNLIFLLISYIFASSKARQARLPRVLMCLVYASLQHLALSSLECLTHFSLLPVTIFSGDYNP